MRYNRAQGANKKQLESDSRSTFFEQEYQTQLALTHLGIKDAASPSDVPKVGSILMRPESASNLHVPYAVEVLGMPRAGKSTVINHYLEELWLRDERHKVALVKEGARSIKQEHGDLRYSDPFSYSLLGGTTTFVDYVSSLKNVNTGMRMVISDRGQIDRRVFRRALFSQGDVTPETMMNESQFINDLENTPIQIGGVIILMTQPEESVRRGKTPGPVTNMNFLPKLYEQYWRLHWEILQGEIPYCIYACIDAEKDKEEVYGRFKYAMDTVLNIHNTLLVALAKAFPEEFDRAKKEHDRKPQGQSYAQRVLSEKLGGKVLIVGGDDMKSKNDILNRPFVEGYHLKK